MIAPRLRHRVDIQAYVTTQDSETGTVEEEWESILDSEDVLIAAEIMPLSGREFVAAQTIQAGVTTRITVRWMTGIVPSMRVVHQGEVYNIKAVLPDGTLRRHITLMCDSGVNDG